MFGPTAFMAQTLPATSVIIVDFKMHPEGGGQHAERISQGLGGILQIAGYAGYNRLESNQPPKWQHFGVPYGPLYCAVNNIF